MISGKSVPSSRCAHTAHSTHSTQMVKMQRRGAAVQFGHSLARACPAHACRPSMMQDANDVGCVVAALAEWQLTRSVGVSQSAIDAYTEEHAPTVKVPERPDKQPNQSVSNYRNVYDCDVQGMGVTGHQCYNKYDTLFHHLQQLEHIFLQQLLQHLLIHI